MSETTTAEYIAEEKALKLETPLERISNHARVRVVVEALDETNAKPWLHLSGSMSPEALEAWRNAVNMLTSDDDV